MIKNPVIKLLSNEKELIEVYYCIYISIKAGYKFRDKNKG